MNNNELIIFPDEYLNTDEMIHDYSFWYQIICEGKKMDFESRYYVFQD